MGTITRFEDLQIWKDARSYSVEIFKLTQQGPFAKDFKFRDQIRASSGSVMDNIAEGSERSSRLEFINFLSISKGSCGEVKSQLYRALDQKYITTEEQIDLYDKYDKLSANIGGFIAYLNKSDIKGQKFKDRK